MSLWWISLCSLLLPLLVNCQGHDDSMSSSMGGRHRGGSDMPTDDNGIVFDDDQAGDGAMTEEESTMEHCSKSRYGCCSDGKTRAQGPNNVGCPETNQVGGCAGTRYGCCADGRTSASGPRRYGCPPCSNTRYGCCKDGRSEARGDRYLGCPETIRYRGGCASTEFGCCNDGVTTARGEANLGCPENPIYKCHMTDYGCCADNQTAATGPDSAGCPEKRVMPEPEKTSCNGSRYGCCPDGMTAAKGLNDEGCPKFDTAFCGAPKDSGDKCAEYKLLHYFEPKYGRCRQFWYGGCGGNQNRFSTEEDCQAKCVNVTGPAVCRLPKVTGPCRAAHSRYYFNARSGKCEMFKYGGCKANANNFHTLRQCEQACNGLVSEEADKGTGAHQSACARNPCQFGFQCQDLRDGGYQCACGPDWGQDCQRIPSYWCFSDDECEGGFKCDRQKHCREGNCQVYARCSLPRTYPCTRARCPSNQDCVNDVSLKEGYFCVDKVDYKRPKTIRLSCTMHEFGCCPDMTSPASGPNNQGCSRSDDCNNSLHGCCADGKTRASGPDYEGCEMEGSADMPCEKTDFGCCDDGVRAASGSRGEGCHDTTDAETTTEPDRGTSSGKCSGELRRPNLCAEWIIKWRYNTTHRTCSQYWWGGCPEGENRFDSQTECQAECMTRSRVTPQPRPTTTMTEEPTEDPDFVNICDMKYEVGPCRGRTPRYYYDPRNRNCRMFDFGGCGGNENNFRSLDECQRECMADIRRPVTAAPVTESPTTEIEPTLVISGASAVKEGSELKVTCVTTGPIAMRLEWFINGQPVTDEQVEITFDRKRITGGIEATGQLIIQRATEANSAIYYCRNSHSQVERMSVQVQRQLEVTTPPTTDKPFESSMTMSGQAVMYEGSELKITCRARGPTDVALYWFINGKSVTDSDNIEVVSDRKRLPGGYEITGNLIIERAREENSGTYYCRSADGQTETMVINVRRRRRPVTDRPTYPPTTTTPAPTRKPAVTKSSIKMMGDAQVPIGSTLTITCRAEGPRRPRYIEWFINRRYVNPRSGAASISNVRDPRSLNALVGTLSIPDANETSAGVYHCRSNPYGDVERMDIRMIDGPAIVTEPPTTTSTTTEVPRRTSPAEVCIMSWDAGNCYESISRWFYDHQTGGCTEMMYGGCDGNENNFKSERECNIYCGARDICFQPKTIGRCRASLSRYYFDAATRSCRQFFYGGCGGNVNNFADEDACENKCADYLRDTTNVDIGDKEREENVCELNPEKGPCRGYNIKWHFSYSRNMCSRFVYTGCGGNDNRFDSKEECQDKCLKPDVIRTTLRPYRTRRPFTRRPVTTETTTPLPTTTTISNVITSRIYSCTEKSDYGTCTNYNIKWYYSVKERKCLRFYYGGCAGNNNRYDSKEDCQNYCMRRIVPSTTPRPTQKPRPVSCDNSRYGCCPDGYTTAVDRWQSNCPAPTTQRPTERPRPVPCSSTRYGCCDDRYTAAVDRWRSNCQDSTTSRPTRRPYSCSSSRYGCCNDGYTMAVDRQRSNCRENQGSGSQSNVMVQSGDDAVLVCPFQNGDITWYRDGFLLTSDSRFQIHDNGTLIVKAMSPDLSGSYACGITWGNNIPELRKFKVITTEPLSIVPGPVLISVKPGQMAFLHCQALGNPRPTVHWTKSGRAIRSNTHQVFGNGTLIISRTNFADEGEYVCTAENGVSAPAQRVYQLKLKENIEAIIDAHDGTFNEGTTIILNCRGEGYPEPTVEWQRDNKDVDVDNRVTIRGGTLVIRSATIDDAGLYKCIATNERASHEDNAYIHINIPKPNGDCRDTLPPYKCQLIITGRLCGFKIFGKKCCSACQKAGYGR